MPLRPHPANPRYFQDPQGNPVYLTGSHHWDVLQENAERPGRFDFEGYLDRLASWGHNFIRFWAHEAWTREVHPRPWLRTPDGRFDLSRFNPEYFGRLRERVVRAGERGFYVGVMLFNGWSIHSKGFGNPWDHHPFNRVNNVNGVDGDPDARGEGADVHTLRVPAVTRVQDAYLEKVVETVGGLDPVLWEISNESPQASLPWQLRMVHRLREIDGGRHPIGVTATFPGNRNEDLFASPADWISPGNKGGWRRSPPPADGSRVVLVDTDHLWGIGGDAGWIWKVFLRGHHPVYMDPLDDDPVRESARRAMGDTLRFSRRIDLAACVPDPERYALVNRTPGREEILAYFPGGRGKIDLSWLAGALRTEWLSPLDGRTAAGDPIAGGRARRVAAPWRGPAVMLGRKRAQ